MPSRKCTRPKSPYTGTWDLVDLVWQADAEALALQTSHQQQLDNATTNTINPDEILPARNRVERHGAIRLGTAAELSTIRRLFAIMGMVPVGYYDLSTAGFPMHATAFRPRTREPLARNPFRVFTTVLRMELLSERGVWWRGRWRSGRSSVPD